MAWASLPTAWAKPKGKGKSATEALVYPMAEISWRDHRSAGIAAFLVIMTLAVRLNESCKSLPPGAVRPTKVAVTWDELRTITGCARATLGKAILLLESWGAIKTTKLGRANHYELVDVHIPGSYCRLPQTFLEADGDPVARFKNLPTNLIGLNALKLYILILILRSNETNTSSISYSGITVAAPWRLAACFSFRQRPRPFRTTSRAHTGSCLTPRLLPIRHSAPNTHHRRRRAVLM